VGVRMQRGDDPGAHHRMIVGDQDADGRSLLRIWCL
jgi:hypothetical protein